MLDLSQRVSFQIIDLGDCANAETSFFSASHVQLEFKKESPNGPECGSNTSAQVELGN